MSNIELFTNDTFRVLAYLYDIRDKNNCARTTQQEVADGLGLSRVTVHNIFKQLKEYWYVAQDLEHVGRYFLTDEAITVIRTFRSVNKKVKEIL